MSEGRRTEIAVRSGEKRTETEVRRECVNKRAWKRVKSGMNKKERRRRDKKVDRRQSRERRKQQSKGKSQ